MANPVTVDAVAARWRPLTDAERAVAEELLVDTWAILTTKVTDLEDRLTADEISTELVTAVVSGIVLRVLKNPSGLLTQSIDGYSYTRDKLMATGALNPTDDELDLLRDADQQSGAFTIVPYGVPGYATDAAADNVWRPWT